ncbi:MAG TPA: sigma-70 family RNA polymerase sigma factor [Solirubrobacteraceae bacterium]|nr:sigma-70 family RNA polymerase sigma factor [Solirubrobacteraceae bacterium]
MTRSASDTALAAAFRDEWGRVVAALIRRTGDWDLAEECAQEAFARAAQRWPRDGTPARPGAWLTTVAANGAVDRLRRARRGAELLERAGREPGAGAGAAIDDLVFGEEEIEDDRLRLIFTCCHPALALEARVALTLRTLTGLSTADIARAFLVSEQTMAKRLTRAKGKIAAAGIPYRVPPTAALPERTSGVLAVIYLLFNTGYTPGASDPLRPLLCDEAIRLARALVQLMPGESEVEGLLALMLLQHSRRSARVDGAGELVSLEDQDRAQWRHEEIREATDLLEHSVRAGRVGPYQLQAAIAACHAQAPHFDLTDWQTVAGLYGLLEAMTPSPVIGLNRAVAVAMAGDLDGALAIVDDLAASHALDDYYLLEATRADLLRRAGRRGAASAAYERALCLAPSAAEQRFLERRMSELSGPPGVPRGRRDESSR